VPLAVASAQHHPVVWADDPRRLAFDAWLAPLATQHRLQPHTLRLASADASFRRYLRLDAAEGGVSLIVMDAPPALEDCRPFVRIAGLLTAAGLHAPDVLAWDEAQGFMLLSDLGSCTYLSALQAKDLAQPPGFQFADRLYRSALESLVTLQSIPLAGKVPDYDEALLRRELDLLPTWYIERHCGGMLTETQRSQLAQVFDLIVKACLAQPKVLVHRDFHSRNLMVCAPYEVPGAGPAPNPGLLDFQDAVHGPITYDVVSLLRDAYVEWDEEVQIDWAIRWWERARKAGLPVASDFGDLWRDLEWMGLQRHLKVLGIFARLAHRDGKDGYLQDLPLVWRYAHRVATRYNGLGPLAHLLEDLAGVQTLAGYTF
jgi:aminoglycoside/choline kinase family phosphotransferase